MDALNVVKFDFDNNDEIGIITKFNTNENELIQFSVGDGIFISKAENKFTSAISVIKGIGNSFVETVKSMDSVPDEISVEFGLVLAAKIGAIIADSTAEANFKISMTWKNNK